MATYHSLPNEVVIEILSHLRQGLDDLDHSERKDLQNVRLVSAQLRDLAAPILFKTYVIDVPCGNLNNENKILEFVFSQPTLTTHVRSLQIRFPRLVDTRELPDIILAFFQNHFPELRDRDTDLVQDVCTFFRQSKQVKWNLPRSTFAGPLFTKLLCDVASTGGIFPNLTHMGFSHSQQETHQEISSSEQQSVNPARYSFIHRLYQERLRKFYIYNFYLGDVCQFSPLTVTRLKLHGLHLCPSFASNLWKSPQVRDLDLAFVTSRFDHGHKGPLFPEGGGLEWQMRLSSLTRLRRLKVALEGDWDTISGPIQTESFFPCFEEMFPMSRKLESLEVTNWPLRLTSLLPGFNPRGSGKEKVHPDDIRGVVMYGGPFFFLQSLDGRKTLKTSDVLIYCHRTVKESRGDTVEWDNFRQKYMAQAFSDARHLVWDARLLDRDTFMRNARRSMPELLDEKCQALIEGMSQGFYDAYETRGAGAPSSEY
ncbi:MAG: hypothetical protein Q9181_007862 [Wetmoreana brouardii]